MLDSRLLETYKIFIHDLSQSSSQIINSYFRKPLSVDSKQDQTPVTIADREAEQYIRGRIAKEYPQHGVIGEEFGSTNERSEFTWVIDPIDGTKSFVCGAVTFGTLIGLLYQNYPVLGSIYFPALDEFIIGDGSETVLNGNRTKIRDCSSVAEAILITTDVVDLYRTKPDLFEMARFHRGLGDCYGYYLVAGGFADIMIDPIMSPWDLLPLIPIITGAGGMISGIHGEEASTAQSAVATCPAIHQQVLDILASS
jgi:myo-inositol-1(or 4)-monophosphatase